MTSDKKGRIKRLEQRATPDGGRVYAMKDSEGLFWVNDKAYSESDFYAEFGVRDDVTVQKVGFDISRL